MASTHTTRKYTLNNFLPILPYLLCTFLFFSLLGLHVSNQKKTYNETIAQAEALTYNIDQNFINTLDTLAKLSASQTTLDFLQLEVYDPVITLNVYSMFSKSFDVISRYDTTIGTYNDLLDLVVANTGTSTLDFLLEKHQFTDQPKIMDFVQNNTEHPSAQAVFKSDSSNYLLYLIKHNHLPETPIFFALFNTDYISRVLAPSGMSFTLDVVIGSQGLPEGIDYSYTSKKLPITYTVAFHPNTLQGRSSLIVNWVLFSLGIFSLSIAIYLLYKRLQCLKTLNTTKNLESQALLLKEVVYGIKKPNIKEALNTCNINILNETFYMLIITLKPEIDIATQLTRDQLDLHISSLDSDLTFKSVTISEANYVVFLQSNTRESLYNTLKPLASLVPMHYLILTDTLTLDQVSKKFYHLNQLVKNNIFLNRSNLLLEEKIDIKLPVSFLFTEQDQKLLHYYLTTQNEAEYTKLVDTLLVENLITRKLSLEFHKQFLTLMCQQLHQFSEDFKDTTKLLSELLLVYDKALLKTQLNELFMSYFNYLVQDQPKKDMQYRFLDYIHNHYSEDISLSDMASEFNLAINYVGVLFKEKTGHNFKDYLNTYRISMAKELLNTSPYIKIKDLSIEVGFLNINTFIRIFKKYEGISPGQYQKYLLEQESLQNKE